MKPRRHVARTAGLYYLGDQGGLNEANSGHLSVTWSSSRPQLEDKGDYCWAKITVKHGNFLRRMDHPS